MPNSRIPEIPYFWLGRGLFLVCIVCRVLCDEIKFEMAPNFHRDNIFEPVRFSYHAMKKATFCFISENTDLQIIVRFFINRTA